MNRKDYESVRAGLAKLGEALAVAIDEDGPARHYLAVIAGAALIALKAWLATMEPEEEDETPTSAGGGGEENA